jgi:uncharacterized protein YkwD
VGGHRTRISILALAIAIALTLLSVFAAGAGAASKPVRTLAAADQLESQVLAELNKIRRQHGLTPLRLSRPLSAAADTHSRAMGTLGFFDHDSRDGSEFWERVQRFYGPDGYKNWSVGENLLWSSGGLSAAAALKLWMGSPGHRRNILTARWREIGLSALRVGSAPGVYGGRDVVIITSDFGVRS